MRCCECAVGVDKDGALGVLVFIVMRGGRGGYFVTVVEDEDSYVFMEAALRNKVCWYIGDEVPVDAGTGTDAGGFESGYDVFVGFHECFC